MDRNLFCHFISKKGPKFRYFAYLEGICNFYYHQKCKWVVLFLEIAISNFRANSTTRESIFKCKVSLFEYHRIVDWRIFHTVVMHFVFELVAPRTSDGVSTDVFNNEHNPFPKIGVTWPLTCSWTALFTSVDKYLHWGIFVVSILFTGASQYLYY
jgi:hypothetical protein